MYIYIIIYNILRDDFRCEGNALDAALVAAPPKKDKTLKMLHI